MKLDVSKGGNDEGVNHFFRPLSSGQLKWREGKPIKQKSEFYFPRTVVDSHLPELLSTISFKYIELPLSV